MMKNISLIPHTAFLLVSSSISMMLYRGRSMHASCKKEKLLLRMIYILEIKTNTIHYTVAPLDIINNC